MGCDIVVALKQSALQGNTLFGLNSHGFGPQNQTLKRIVGRVHAPGETLRLGTLDLPQVRRTFTVLGNQSQESWGLTHGINEHRVVAGFCRWQTRLPAAENGLLGTELIRLALERSQSARQAVDILTDLLTRHGQRLPGDGNPSADNIFLLADAREAFVVEAAGTFWASLECQQVRAVSDVGLIRQDWRRLSPGLAEFAISNGWWGDDGSKLDVAGSVCPQAARQAWALKRWGKATLQLEQQNGYVDPVFLRHMLGDHFETTAASAPSGEPLKLATSFLAVLSAQEHVLPVAWCAYGPARSPLYFPILLDGDLPRSSEPGRCEADVFPSLEELLEPADHPAIKESVERLQARFDQETEEFLEEARVLLVQGNRAHVARQAGLLMQNHWELAEAEWRRLPTSRPAWVAVH